MTQNDLAEEAKVSISTVRDVEAGKRPLDTESVDAIRKVLESRDVEFIGLSEGGAGVRFAEPRPRLSFGPVSAAGGLGLIFWIDRDGGKPLKCLVSREAIEDLGHLTGREGAEALIATFKAFQHKIVECAIELSFFENTTDLEGRVVVRSRDVARPRHIPKVFRELKAARLVALDPAPIRILKGVRQAESYNEWAVLTSQPAEGKCVLQNLASDHLLVLYAAHVDSIAAPPPDSMMKGTLELRVQPIVEDGHYRLEHPKALR